MRFVKGDLVVIESPVFSRDGLVPIDPTDPAAYLGWVAEVIEPVDRDCDVFLCLAGTGEDRVYVLEDGLVPFEPKDVEPLPAPIESRGTHDPYINRHFLAIMGHADNADLSRALTVGLAINDPERPVGPPSEPRSPVALDTKEKADNDAARDVLQSRDADGDGIKFAYNRDKSAILIVTDPRGHYLRIADIPALIVWLKSRETKHRGSAS